MIKTQVNGKTPEDFDKAVRVFKKQCNNDGFLKELQERRYYKKPSEKRREKIREFKKNLTVQNKRNKDR